MNYILEVLDTVTESSTSTELECDLAEALKMCVDRINALETKLVNLVLTP
jgi:hypothetical protein